MFVVLFLVIRCTVALARDAAVLNNFLMVSIEWVVWSNPGFMSLIDGSHRMFESYHLTGSFYE